MIQQPETLELPTAYRIRLAGELDRQWADWFPCMVIQSENGQTVLTGPVPDQAALFGMIKLVRDLNLFLIAVEPISTQT